MLVIAVNHKKFLSSEDPSSFLESRVCDIDMEDEKKNQVKKERSSEGWGLMDFVQNIFSSSGLSSETVSPIVSKGLDKEDLTYLIGTFVNILWSLFTK